MNGDDWQVVKASTESDLSKTKEIRFTVFVDEQGVPADHEMDEMDATSHHWLLLKNLGNSDWTPIGTIRMFEEEPGIGRLGRMAVLKAHRGNGNGRKLISALEDFAWSNGFSKITLHGQLNVKGFYASCGYVQVSDEIFEEEGILHVHMAKLRPSSCAL
jgi:predicted GNAT family N-acyltransferase